MFDLRLIRAEVLKLRRRRGMLAIAAGITLGVVALAFGVSAIQHAGNPGKYEPAGGAASFTDAINVLVLLTIVAGAIVGSTAGAQDLESGVFRDLAATGRSRIALFGARVTGAWAIVLPLAALSAGASAGAAVLLAGSLAAPTSASIVAGTLGLLATAALSSALAVGLSALIGSRGPVIAIVLAFNLAIAQMLVGISFLGDVRQAIPTVALARVAHTSADVHTTLGVAVAVLAAWIAAALAAGAWRTKTREI
jgi:ABC-type transport system involved in multi-copper enzyme maturation permease subunit